LPAFDPDVFEDEAQELLALLEVRGVESGQGPLREGADALIEPVVLGQFGALFEERLAFVAEPAVTGLEFLCPPAHLGFVDHAGLVEVCEAPPLGVWACPGFVDG
jgi:hypothetical protein